MTACILINLLVEAVHGRIARIAYAPHPVYGVLRLRVMWRRLAVASALRRVWLHRSWHRLGHVGRCSLRSRACAWSVQRSDAKGAFIGVFSSGQAATCDAHSAGCWSRYLLGGNDDAHVSRIVLF